MKKFGINKKFILLHGRMIKDKRPDLAIKAFSKLKKDILLGRELKIMINNHSVMNGLIKII